MYFMYTAILSSCTEEGIRFNKTRVKTAVRDLEPPCKCWESNSGPFREQLVLPNHWDFSPAQIKDFQKITKKGVAGNYKDTFWISLMWNQEDILNMYRSRLK